MIKEVNKNIVWDWNGTLLNDSEVGVLTLNDMLTRRNIQAVSPEEYKKIFEFPVINFYNKVGFDITAESFHNLSVDFVNTYEKYSNRLSINKGVIDILKTFKNKGYKQYVLSALKEDLLIENLKKFNIYEYFDGISGSNDIYASGKIEQGKKFIEKMSIKPQDTIMIGDTVHDAEVAEALGFSCILYTQGHNDVDRLQAKAKIFDDMRDLKNIDEVINTKH